MGGGGTSEPEGRGGRETPVGARENTELAMASQVNIRFDIGHTRVGRRGGDQAGGHQGGNNGRDLHVGFDKDCCTMIESR